MVIIMCHYTGLYRRLYVVIQGYMWLYKVIDNYIIMVIQGYR